MASKILFLLAVKLMFYNVYTVDVSSTDEIRLQMSSNNEIFEVCPDRPLNIIIQRCTECYGFYIESCWSRVFEYSPNDYTLKLEIAKVTADFNGAWTCKIMNEWDQNFSRVLHFTVLVKDPKPPKIIVNHLILPTVRDVNNCTVSRAEYYYNQGDTIDIYCYSQKDACSVQMKYGDVRSELSYGERFAYFQIRSKPVHEIECICYCSSYYVATKVIIRFVQNTFEDINLRIDGNRLQTFFIPGTASHTYGYFAQENVLEVTCWTNNGKFISVQGGNKNYIQTTIHPRNQNQFDITIFSYYNEQVTITIKFIRMDLIELNHIIMVNNLILPIHQQDGHNIAKYYYAKSDYVAVSCITLKDKCSGYMKQGYSRTETKQVLLQPGQFVHGCTCNSNSTTKVEIQFNKKHYNGFSLSIDGEVMAFSSQQDVVYLNYGYYDTKKYLYIKCRTYDQNYIAYFYLGVENDVIAPSAKQYHLERAVDPFKNPRFAITISSRNAWIKSRRIEISFTPLLMPEAALTTSTTIIYNAETTVTPPTTNSSIIAQPSDTNDSQYSINQGVFIAVGIVMMICLISVITYSYKIIKRSRRMQRGLGDNYNNLQNDAATAIPIYPPQWESKQTAAIVHQTNDINETDDDIYENTNIKREIPENIYINCNIQNNRNISEAASESELTYADIDHSEKVYANQIRTKRIPRYNLNRHNEPYAQIEVGHSKTAAKTANDANYVNTDNYDYVEPAYTEVVR